MVEFNDAVCYHGTGPGNRNGRARHFFNRRLKNVASAAVFQPPVRTVVLLLLLLTLIFLAPGTIQAKAKEKIAVLPFKIHSLEPLDHLKKGLQEMLSSRLAEKGYELVDPGQINRHPMVFLETLKKADLIRIGRDLGAELVVSGSLTQIGRKISLDLKAVDVTGRRAPFTVFVVEDDVEKLADAADKATKSLYTQIAGLEPIDSLEVTGNRRVESEAILSVVESKKGEALDYDQLDKDLRAIYAMGYFKDVKIETKDGPKGKIVIFVVSEKPSIGSISFKGNRKVKDKVLKQEIGIKRYSILNLSDIKQSINRLREFYRKKGYYNVRIKEKIEDLPQNEVALTYEIDEGEKVFIRHIEFVGNKAFDDGDLKDLMETSEKGWFSWFTKSGLLDRKKLEFDLQKITAFYHNHGYIKAKTGDPEITVEKGDGLTITIQVIEGPQYKVDRVSVTGDMIKPEEELLKQVHITKEKYFKRETVRRDVMSLREIYADEGYAYVEVVPYTKENDEKHLVDITYKVSKGPKVRIERINITGNTYTRDKVIRRELELIEGDYFSGRGLKKSTANINRLGYFENVEVQPKKGSAEDLMIVDINVKERATGSFSLGAGYSSFEKTVGSFNISERNLFGKGLKLSGSARLGSRTTEFDIKFVEPWLFDRRLSMGIDAFNWKREYRDYTKDSTGGALQFKFPLGLDEYTTGLVRYSYDNADISDVADTAALAIREMVGNHVTSSIRLGIIRDSTDRPWNTTSGSKNSLYFEYAGGILGGDVYFNRYEFKTEWYFPLPWETVFMARGRWGYIQSRSGGILPIYQKYFIGGINTVRGFDYQNISPKDPATGDRIGGEKMMVYNFEYRFPVAKKQGVVGLVFVDAGNVFGSGEGFSFGGLKKSFGTGIRWYSPVGPIRIEYGWVIGPKKDEPTGNLEFMIGGLF
ncbi:MAG: outer membrane protein assembly factor BamA [Deltaproteobacteria bacterium]|nr:outer membrane protein assembly factor BamA [Deltaproteobacteria bacterium]MBW2127872.1 outer membrane protein assembly factor BamA [Deltaproteobacteria bacterium]MBW2302876.1 outer membrane protein assembly factor BamA [Deltaproteobacteria bacterium]